MFSRLGRAAIAGFAWVLLVGCAAVAWSVLSPRVAFAIFGLGVVVLALATRALGRRHHIPIAVCRLGDGRSERGAHGLRLVDPGDGYTRRIIRGWDEARQTDIEQGQGFVYFQLREKLAEKLRASGGAIVGVEYFDSEIQGGQEFRLQFDAVAGESGETQPAAFEGSSAWRVALFQIERVDFRRRIPSPTGGADLRIVAGPNQSTKETELLLKRVFVVALPEAFASNPETPATAESALAQEKPIFR
jgi:hypothetical protein